MTVTEKNLLRALRKVVRCFDLYRSEQCEEAMPPAEYIGVHCVNDSSAGDAYINIFGGREDTDVTFRARGREWRKEDKV